MAGRLCTLALLCAAAARAVAAPVPVVIFHGMGDSAESEGMLAVAARVSADTGGAYVRRVYVGSPEDDVHASYFGLVRDQLRRVCAEQLEQDASLVDGFHAVGFSQGGQFVRFLAQVCNVRVRTLVTLGAQHGGVATVPGCSGPAGQGFCTQMQKLVEAGAYRSFVQKAVVQAQYFRDAHDEDAFLQHSMFLAEANNLLSAKNETYRDRVLALERLVLFRFADDATVVPRDSAWFSMLRGADLVPLREQPLYTQDWLGLRALDESGRLVFAECPGAHMQFSLDWFSSNVIKPYLGGDAALLMPAGAAATV